MSSGDGHVCDDPGPLEWMEIGQHISPKDEETDVTGEKAKEAMESCRFRRGLEGRREGSILRPCARTILPVSFCMSIPTVIWSATTLDTTGTWFGRGWCRHGRD